MNKNKSSADGFISRNPTNMLGRPSQVKNQANFDVAEHKLLHTTGNDKVRQLGQLTGNDLGRADIEESLNDIDQSNKSSNKLSRHQRHIIAKQGVKRPHSLISKIIKWAIVIFILIVLTAVGLLVYKSINAGQNIFQGSIFNIFNNQPLKQDVNGRSNFLILGTSEDDPGHNGASLTDSILVLSVDQTKKDVYMFSIPRDMSVDYHRACPAGYSGKVNAYFSCVNDGSTNNKEQERLLATQKLIGDVVGLDIQYGIHADQTVVKQAVDAVGGIDVDIEGSNGAPGILDRNADWRCNYTCYYVKYTNGVHHLDGIHALYLSMARGHSEPTYGLGNSNFDREKNQQKIIVALKDKAMTTGILTNLSAVTKLIDALGNNLRTNIQTSEIRTIMQVASDVKPSDIHMLSLFEGDKAVFDGSGEPKAGVFKYSGIRTFIKNNLLYGPVFSESAPVVVLNGTGQSGLGQSKANSLTSQGFNVVLVANAPNSKYTSNEIYQIGDGNQATADKLASIFGVPVKKDKPPVKVTGNVRFVVIIGVTSSSTAN